MMRTITITSGKGGVGKTNVSVNLALHLATLGYRTCLFDADLGLANVNILTALYPEYNLEDVILGNRDLDDVIIRNYEGIDIIPGSSGVERIANLEAEQIRHLIQSFSELDEYDFLLFDTSAGVSRNVISFCLASSEVILVITPEATSLTDSYALLKILCVNGFKGSVKIVVNQCRNTSIAKHAYTKFNETVKKYLPVDVVPLGIILQDRKVEDAVKEQHPFVSLYPESNASRCIKSIAKRLMEEEPEDLGSSGMSLFWTRCLKFAKSPLKLTAKKKERKEIAGASPRQGGPDNSLPVLRDSQIKDRRDILRKIDTHKDLPTLPHVVLKLIEACNSDESTIEYISQIVGKDAQLSWRVMNVANGAYDGPRNSMGNIEEAVSFLGKDAMKTIAVGTAAYSGFEQVEGSSAFGLKRFWRHSLMCATLARLIAGKTSYPAPEQAFLSGLLHDIGKLVLWVNFPKQYADILQAHRSKPDLLLAGEMRLGATHCEVGSWMVNRWGLRSFMADAVLYHHEAVHRILDALPLVKVVFVANALCSEAVENGGIKCKAAEEVFEFTRPEVDELTSLAEKEVKQAAELLKIDFESSGASRTSGSEKDAEKQKALAHAVRDISLLQGSFQSLLEADGVESILKVVKRGLQVLFDVHSVLFFLYDRRRDVLISEAVTRNMEKDLANDLAIPFKEDKSLVARSLCRKSVLDSFRFSRRSAPTIVDKQLIRILGKEGMLCLPMVAHKDNVGVMVLATDAHHIFNLRDQMKLLTMFAKQAALALAADHSRRSETDRLKDVVKKIQEALERGLGDKPSKANKL